MNEIIALVNGWRRNTLHTYEDKKCISRRNPSMPEELLLYFTNSLHSFYCGTELIPINLVSGPFLTTTLSRDPISKDNPNADLHRLKVFLDKFDEQFYELVKTKTDECGEELMSSDPIWF